MLLDILLGILQFIGITILSGIAIIALLTVVAVIALGVKTVIILCKDKW